MNHSDRRRHAISASLAWGSAAVLVLAFGLSVAGVEPFPSLFYILAWYPYILVMDHFAYRKVGESLIMNRPGELIVMMIWSAGFWILFEGINLRLQNWSYVHVEPWAPLRYALGFVSFATVLPGVFCTRDALCAWGLVPRASIRRWSAGPRLQVALVLVGFASLALPLLWPRFFFPLVWGAFVFLLEPLVLAGNAERSLLAEARRGSAGTLVSLLGAGCVCGAVWEFFNIGARTRWEYHVPFVGGWKIFEMPVLGFLGFPPFAVECWVMYAAVRMLGRRFREACPRAGSLAYGALALLFTVALGAFVFPRADRVTIKTFRPESLAVPFFRHPPEPQPGEIPASKWRAATPAGR